MSNLYEKLKPRLLVFVNENPIQSNKFNCPEVLLKDEGFRRFVRIVFEARAIAGGELVMPFLETLELSIPQIALPVTDPEMQASLLREQRIKQAIITDCRQDRQAFKHLLN